jgi:hypothetical protein
MAAHQPPKLLVAVRVRVGLPNAPVVQWIEQLPSY